MHQTASAPRVLRRLYPWLGRAVHKNWSRRRSLYQEEAAALIVELDKVQGRIPSKLAFRLEGYLGRLHQEWFPRSWRNRPNYAEVVNDFEWWLNIAEGWSQPRNGTRKRATRKPKEPLAQQPPELLRILDLPRNCSQKRFMTEWRRFLKENHPDLNPKQTAAERRRFKEAVSLWKRQPSRAARQARQARRA